MEIKIAFNYPEKPVRVVREYLWKWANRNSEEEKKKERGDKLREKFFKNNPLLDKISKVAAYCYFFSLIPFLVIFFFSYILPRFGFEIPEIILDIVTKICFGAYIIVILAFFIIEALAVKFKGEKIFKGRIKGKLKDDRGK